MKFDSSMNRLHVSVQSGVSLSRRLTLIFALSGAIVFVIASTACASASAHVLYDQTTGTPGGFVPSEGGVVADETDTFAADDFTVPPGPRWYVNGVHVDGSGGIGSYMGWLIFRGGDVPAEGEGSIGLKDSGFNLRGASKLSPSGDLIFGNRHGKESLGSDSLGTALPPGHYWLKVHHWVQIGSFSTTRNNWGWQTQSPQAGSAAVWLDHTSGSCSDENHHYLWHPLADCNQPGPDLRFRILGQEMGRKFYKFQLGKSRRMPSGGLAFPHVTLPGYAWYSHSDQFLTVHKVSGKGGVKSITPHRLWRFAGSYPDSYFTGPLKIKPTPKTRKQLKRGRVLKLRVKVTYRRSVGLFHPSPPTTQKRNIVLKKP